MSSHVFLVGIEVEADLNLNQTRAAAEVWVHSMLNTGRRGVEASQVGNPHVPDLSWWVAEDDRRDRSDNDSAVFVHKGQQKAAADVLHLIGYTAEHNVRQPEPVRKRVTIAIEGDDLDEVMREISGIDDLLSLGGFRHLLDIAEATVEDEMALDVLAEEEADERRGSTP